MEDFAYFGLARALHVVGVVLWIGGVAFVTTTLIPSLRAMSNEDEPLVLHRHFKLLAIENSGEAFITMTRDV